MNPLEKVHIGTSGWSYKHWSGVFYPPEVKPDKYLEHYVKHFDCTELNASFYRLPKEQTVKSWLTRTPPGFKFCAKLSRLITHQKKLKDVEEPLAVFFDLFAILKERLGPVLVQLPPSLKFDESRATEFFELLREKYRDYTFALEARHPTWFDESALKLLEKYQIAFVIAHSGGRFPYGEAVTAPQVYFRFHGPGRLYASDYPDEMLEEFAEKIVRLVQQGHDVWAFFNNDVHGYAVKNALTLREMVHRKLSPVGISSKK